MNSKAQKFALTLPQCHQFIAFDDFHESGWKTVTISVCVKVRRRPWGIQDGGLGILMSFAL